MWHHSLHTSRFASLLALTMGTNIIIAGLSLVSGVSVARFLGPDGRGEFAAMQSWPTILAILSSLGVADALVFYSAKNPNQAGRWLTTAMSIALVASIPFALFGYALMPLALDAQTPDTIQAARVYLWIVPLYAITAMMAHPLRGKNDLVAWNIVRSLPPLAWIVVIGVCYLSGFTTAAFFAQGYLLAFALLAIPTGIIVKRRVGNSFLPSLSNVAPLLKYGFPVLLNTIPATFNIRLAQLWLANASTPQSLGLYAVALAWSSAVAPITNALPSVLLPRIAGTSSGVERSRFIGQGMRIGIVLAVLFSFGVAVSTPIAVPLLFGENFKPAIVPAIILSFASGLTGLVQLLESAELGLGEPRIVLIAEVIGLATNLVLLSILLISLELVGASLAALFSSIIVLGFLIIQITRQTNMRIQDLLLPSISDFRLVLKVK